MSVAACGRRTAAARGARALLVVGALALGCERGPTEESRPPDRPSEAPPAGAQAEPEAAPASDAAEVEAVEGPGGEATEAAEGGAAEPGRATCGPDLPTFTEELLAILGPIDELVFEFDKAVIKPQSYAALDRIAEVLHANPEVLIYVEGHRDEDPHWRERAVEITRRRAAAVREYLIAKGVAPDRLEARGFGPTQPRAPNDSKENRALNRRVELRAPALSDDVILCVMSERAGRGAVK